MSPSASPLTVESFLPPLGPRLMRWHGFKFEHPPFPRPFPFDVFCELLGWVFAISPQDLHSLASTNRLLFSAAERFRWNTLSIELDSRPGRKSMNTAMEVLFGVEGRPARVVNIRLTATQGGKPKAMFLFVDRFLKAARGLRTLHIYDTQTRRTPPLRFLTNFTSFPFKLTELVIHALDNVVTNVPDIVISQSAIERLSIYTRGDDKRDISALHLPNDALPNLTAVSTFPDTVRLVEGRPVRYLHILAMWEWQVKTLEAMFRSSTKPITAVSLCGDVSQDVTSFLPCLLHFAPKLRFLGCQWTCGALSPEDVKPLRNFTELECIRWCSLAIHTKREMLELSQAVDPKFYAGPSLRVVQQEIEGYEGVWCQADCQANRWRLNLGEFISPPLVYALSLLRLILDVLCQVAHTIGI